MGGQSFLRWEGVNRKPVEMALTLAPLGTKRGTPEDDPIIQGDSSRISIHPKGRYSVRMCPSVRGMRVTLGMTWLRVSCQLAHT